MSGGDKLSEALLVGKGVTGTPDGACTARFSPEQLPLEDLFPVLLRLQANKVHVGWMAVEIIQAEHDSRQESYDSRDGQVEPEADGAKHLKGHAPVFEKAAVQGLSVGDRDDQKPDQDTPPHKEVHDRVPEEGVHGNLEGSVRL